MPDPSRMLCLPPAGIITFHLGTLPPFSACLVLIPIPAAAVVGANVKAGAGSEHRGMLVVSRKRQERAHEPPNTEPEGEMLVNLETELTSVETHISGLQETCVTVQPEDADEQVPLTPTRDTVHQTKVIAQRGTQGQGEGSERPASALDEVLGNRSLDV